MANLRYPRFMHKVDFDFGRYVAFRKGAQKAQRREGANYAFSADLRMLRKIERLGPVQAALEEAGRLFQRQAQKDLLDASTKVTKEQHARLYAAAKLCADRLHIAMPPVYVTQEPKEPVPLTLGVFEDAYILLPSSLLSDLSDDELLFAIGAECGRIQNGHIALRTALFYMTHVPTGFLRFAVLPIKSIFAVWLRRAHITADRAGLICCRNLEVSASALEKILQAGDPLETGRRKNAITRFAESQYYRALFDLKGGESLESNDEAVAALLDDSFAVGKGAV